MSSFGFAFLAHTMTIVFHIVEYLLMGMGELLRE